MNPEINNEKRLDILQFIEKNPGIILNDIYKSLKIPQATVLHHIKVLEQNKQILQKNIVTRKRYFPKNLTENELLTIIALRTPTSKEILLQLLNSDEMSFQLLVDLIKKTPSTLSTYLSQLVENKLVEFRFKKRIKHYYLSDKKILKNLLNSYSF